jgi:hypothetical protein
MSPVRRLLSRLFLALALIVAQAGGATHALSHAGQTSSHRDGHHAPKAPQCDVCHAFAAADTADAPTPNAVLDLPGSAPLAPAVAEALVVTSDPPPYAGRAPPSIS